MYGAIEAGGTKFVCALARDVDDIVAERTIPTTGAAETMARVVGFFAEARGEFAAPRAIGIAAFGPVDLRQNSPDWGRLLATPKPDWSHASFVQPLREMDPHCPLEIDTDVNAAALAEWQLGVGRGCRSVVYVTVGTGIGGGAVIAGHTLRGWPHPEMGHIYVRRHPCDLEFAGSCRFHRDCLEGLASGAAIRKRWRADLAALGPQHAAHAVIGHYLGQLAGTIALLLSPDVIVFGGGVMSNRHLLPPTRESMRSMLGDYLPGRGRNEPIDASVQLSSLRGRAGLLGAILLAKRATGDWLH